MDYFILFLISRHAFKMSKMTWLSSGAESAAFLYCGLMGVATEQAERFVPGRTCSFNDFLADLAGAGLAWIILQKIFSKKAV